MASEKDLRKQIEINKEKEKKNADKRKEHNDKILANTGRNAGKRDGKS